MDIRVHHGKVTDIQTDCLIVNLFEGVTSPQGATGAIDQQIGGLISKIIADQEFKGELGETAVLHLASDLPFRKVVVGGLGKKDDFTPERVRQVAATSLKTAAKGNVRQIATIVHGAGVGGLDPAFAAQCVAEGATMALYRYLDYKSDPPKHPDIEITVVEMDASKIDAIQRGIDKGVIMGQSVNFARDLINAPGNDVTPTVFAERTRQMAEETGLECTILDQDEMERLGMGSLLGVAKGSAEPPKLIVLRHRGSDEEQPFALVGKGVTFDSGGISLKPAAGMADMKSDMSGAAGVVGAMRAIARLGVKKHVIAVAACVENLPSGTSFKPGDILRSMTGKTIEIDNTDAEGRLVLADAVAYAESLGAHTIVDVATLTGACVIALGSLYTGVISNSDELTEALLAAAEVTGERYWRLPSDPEYKQQYKSDVADIKNTGGREGGAITGALIIGEFIKEARWAHLDIAGTSFTSEDKHYLVKGGTGVTVRTLAELVAQD